MNTVVMVNAQPTFTRPSSTLRNCAYGLLVGKTKDRDHLEDLGVDERMIILK